MGVSKMEHPFKCPCWGSNQRETFQKLIELKGLVIYHGTIPTNNVTRDADSGNATDNDTDTEYYSPSTKGNVFILLNTKNDKIMPGNIMRQLDKNNISCPRCRQILEHASKRMQTIPVIEERDIIGICDHCYFNASSIIPTPGSCVCKREVETFLSTRERPFGGLTTNMKKIIQSWLSELDHVLNKKDSKKVLQRVIRRSYSEVDINLYGRKVKKTPREPKIQTMFYDGKSVSDTEYVKKEEHTRDFVEHSNLKRSHKIFNNRILVTSDDTVNVSTNRKGLHNMKQEDSDSIKERRQHIVQPRIIDDRSYQNKNMPKRSTIKTDTIVEYKSEKTGHDILISKETDRRKHFNILHREVETKEKYNKLEKSSQNDQFSKNFTKIRQEVVSKDKSKNSERLCEYDTSDKNVAKTSKKRRFGDLDKMHEEEEPKKRFKRSEAQKEKKIEEQSQKTDKKLVPLKKNLDEEVKIKNKQKEHVSNLNAGIKHFPKEKKISSGTEDIKKNFKQSTKEPLKNTEDSMKKHHIVSRNDEDIQGKPKKKAEHSKTKRETNKTAADDNVKINDSRKEPVSNKGKGNGYPVNVENISVDIKDMMKNINQFAKHKESLKKTKDTSVNMKEVKKKHKEIILKSEDTVREKHFVSKNNEDIKENLIKRFEHSKIKQENKTEINDNSKIKDNQKEPISNKEKGKDYSVNVQDISVDIKDIMKNINQSAKHKDLLLKKTKDSIKELKDSKYNQGAKDRKQEQPKVESSEIKQNSSKEDGRVPRNKTKDLPIFDEKQKTFKSEDKVKSVKIVEAENKIHEIKIAPNKLKLQKPSGDDLILKLIQIHQSTYIPREKHEDDKIINKVHNILKKRSLQNRIHDKLEVKFDAKIHNEKGEPEFQDIIIGEQVCQYKLPFLPIQIGVEEVEPIIFHSDHKDELAIETPKNYKGIPDQLEDDNKNLQLFDDASAKGIIRYALSDRSFIEKGWTALPMEKVVRKVNIYRMYPAHPEFDWFENNKNKGPITYDTGEKLAEIDEAGHGRWYYRNGRLALDYYDAEETNAQQRFVVYSSGERDERGRLQPITLLATFDYLGNGVVFDHAGKIRLKYNQTEGVVLDRSIGPVSQWKWHSLNDPPVLQQVMIDNQLAHKDPKILKMGDQSSKKSATRTENEDMLAIEFENFIKEKGKKLTQKFKPFQIKMKALKINEHFSLRVLDQASIYLIFRDGSTNLKINMGMILNHQEIVDTDIAEVGEVSNSMECFPAKTDSIAQLQQRIAHAQRYERMRTERERRLHPQQPCESADNLTAAASRPLRPALRTKPMTQTESTSNTAYCSCSRKPSNNFYYDTRLS